MPAVSFLDVEKSAMVEARLRELGGGERTCQLECEDNTIHEAVLLAASDAFDSARRQLSELSMMRGGQRA